MTRLTLLLLLGTLGCDALDPARPDDDDEDEEDEEERADAGPESPDAGTFPEGTNPCESLDNAPGPVQELAWPAESNIGHLVDIGATLRFSWSGVHNVVQVADFAGTPIDPATGLGMRSGDPEADGQFDWHVGTFPCGYRPGLYYFADETQGGAGVTAVSLTEPEFDQDHFEPRPCSDLEDPDLFGGRYAVYADRPGCTIHEVNNFQTRDHYDWVDPTFAARQGDLVLFRWTGFHSVIQVHDVLEDELVGPGAITSGAKRNCAGGPNYLCANGPSSLGEHLIDTQDWRPGMIHLSDECAYNAPECPSTTGPSSGTGMNMQFLLRAREQEAEAGACCAIDATKGQACRVVDLWNDNDGMQFSYNVPVNRGDLVRLRWSGTLHIVQVEPNGDNSPSQTPLAGGISTSGPVECVPGAGFSCIGSDDDAALVIDVDRAIRDGQVHESDGETFFLFHAFGENLDGFSSADSGILLYLGREDAYSPNPACD